ncbi:short-subunit dehydrogenase [Microbacteriaceae bacterium SG_E_30_P1]|uniref:Short-subunit dehydrogenase n=1 Tax=Antiquaquibacter oligotrophicus TaxID=2880260 RepID=A0ABT6KN25_9MICO|nr:SDR family NAD(P)-dependent oxidoreductase [Antiquaquibacter oligotrophicus]MDH6181410.1 short-subunit dehydrogenase [Antiquaquibacter oligotrophicus]UDF12898.1 SDR family NAD(P)-dependent oxidoreductase [Antiquaquibacter oligotrophicus]
MVVSLGTALITGATAGIGAEFAVQLAARGHDLVLVARDEQRLERMADALRGRGVGVEVLAADLSEPAGVARVVGRVDDETRPIEVVVNNAGFGLHTDFDLSPVEDEVRLLEVLATAPLRINHAALRSMVARGRGRIVNVTSVAAFAPLGSYSAAKAWLHTFSRWANAFYRPAGVTVTALAPGYVRTEFHARVGLERSSMAPEWLWLNVEPVVRQALRDSDRGRAMSIPSARYAVIARIASALPLGVISWVARRERWGFSRRRG